MGVSGRRTRRASGGALGLAVAIGVVLALCAGSSRAVTTARPVAPHVPAGGRLAAILAARLERPLAARTTLPVANAGLALGARAIGTPCGKTAGLLCSQVDVPLDRAGVVPGTISLHVETLPAAGVARGTVFLIAGGPGQGSARAFSLGTPGAAALYRYLFPGYTLVAYDDRGTGDSGVLRCDGLQTTITIDVETDLAADCATSLGPQRDFYSTHEHAEDLEAVRVALGVDKVALWGTSYGTKLAVAYALAHPDHVERLLLDSVVPPDQDTYETDVLRAMPGTLAAYCGGGICRSATSDFAGDVVTVANRLAAKPAQLKVLQANGTKKLERINGLALLSVIIEADLNPGLAADLPAAVHAATVGDLRPLFRLLELVLQGSIVPPEDLSWGLFAATVCRDGPFPWSPDAAIADRPALLQAAIAALPAGSFGRFGTWAAANGTASLCLAWPSPSGGAALGPGPLPDVPVLAISGGFDMRTPTTGATAVISRFPQGHLLVAQGVGHSVLSSSLCAIDAVHNWILGTVPVTTCPRENTLATVPAYPAALTGKNRATPARTLAIVSQTLRDAEGVWVAAAADQIAGLTSGKLVSTREGLTLVRYGVVSGIEVSGKLKITGTGLPLHFEGTVVVGGSAAATGVLGVKANKLGGTLGGKIVRG